jgi:hypothetical protein
LDWGKEMIERAYQLYPNAVARIQSADKFTLADPGPLNLHTVCSPTRWFHISTTVHLNASNSEYPDQRYRIRRSLKNRLTVNSLHFKKFGKIIENQKNPIEMQLTCKRNKKNLEIQNSAELTELSAEFADISIEFFKNSATDYQPV